MLSLISLIILEGFRMRISNNQKRMVTTHILGLFLTVATPLSLSLISTSSAIATDITDLNQSVMFDKQPLPVQLGLVEKHLESEPKVPTITLSEEGKISTYNLGHALHGLKTTLEAKGNSVFLNELLQHFRSENPVESQEIAADMAARMIYQCFRLTVELVANRTAGQNLEAIKLNWDAINRLWDVTSKSLAYQNIFKKLLADQATEAEQETSSYEMQSARWDEENANEESQLKQEHLQEVDSLERKKGRTEATLDELNKTFNEIEEPAPSQIQEYLASKKIHEGTIQNCIQEIELAKSQFAKAKKERAEALSKKKDENELAIKQLKENHNLVKQTFISNFSFIFEDLGGGWLPTKTLVRMYYKKSTNREGYDYTQWDKELLASPEFLKDGNALIVSKILATSAEMKAPPIAFFSEPEILDALLTRIDNIENTTISISKDASVDENIVTRGGRKSSTTSLNNA
jgi:hypothetical protein